eukprot:2268958-Rhodomonas_salina.3
MVRMMHRRTLRLSRLRRRRSPEAQASKTPDSEFNPDFESPSLLPVSSTVGGLELAGRARNLKGRS